MLNRALARRGVAVAALGAVSLGVVSAGATQDAGLRAPAAKARPNIILVVTDDQDKASFRVMAKARRKLGRRGVTFTNAFATYPLCCPARATLLSGRYAHNHGVLDNALPSGGLERFDEESSVAVDLQDAGYRTGFVGKYLNGYPKRVALQPEIRSPGWDRWFAISEAGMFDWAAYNNRAVREFGRKERDYQTDVLARVSKRFIGAATSRSAPFFLTVMTNAPHTESGRRFDDRNPRPAPRHRDAFEAKALPMPPSFNEDDISDKPEIMQAPPLLQEEIAELRDVYRGRLESLLAVDDLVGGLVGRLRRANELRNTYVIFTSDNGFLLGEHRLTRKRVLYEESARVPLVIRGPGLPAGRARRQLTGNVDIAATLLDLAGLRRPTGLVDGVSLLRLIEQPDDFRDRPALLENWRVGSADGRGSAIRTRGWILIEQEADGARHHELYDLRPKSLTYDPFQLENRYHDPEFRDVRERLTPKLDALRDCRGQGQANACP